MCRLHDSTHWLDNMLFYANIRFVGFLPFRFDIIFLISGLVSMVFLYFVHKASGSSNILAKDPVFEQFIENDDQRYSSQSNGVQATFSSDSQYGLSSGTHWRSRGF